MTLQLQSFVALTFDDAVSNHASFVAPLLLRYGFGATFYVTEFVGEGNDCFETDKRQYMTWEQIRELDKLGFEIGNHTGHHRNLRDLAEPELMAEIEHIENRCAQYGISKPTTFCYPGGIDDPRVLPLLETKKYCGARCSGNRAYDPAVDSPYLIPSFVIKGSDSTSLLEALQHIASCHIVVLTLHGVPDYNHPWVDTPPEIFEHLLEALAQTSSRIVALRDLPALRRSL